MRHTGIITQTTSLRLLMDPVIFLGGCNSSKDSNYPDHRFNNVLLTHWGRDEIDAIFPVDIFKCIF